MRLKIINIFLFTILILGEGQICYGQKTIQMQKEGGVYTVPCSLNGVNLKFIFDTGASNVSISLTEASFLFKNGYLTDNDIQGQQNFANANGQISVGTIINIRKLEFSGIVLNDVKATIVHNLDAPLLLGQTAMAKLGKFQFDPNNGTITILNDFNDFSINDNPFLYDFRGLAKAKRGDFEGAIIDYTKAIEIESSYGSPFLHRGVSKMNLGDYRGGLSDAIKASELMESSGVAFEAYALIGECKYFLKDNQGSFDAFNKAIVMGPNYLDNARTYYLRGFIYYNYFKDKEGACKNWRKAVKLGDKNADDALKKYCK